MTAALHVAIVGAGIGGLTAATALLAKGMSVSVYEQAPVLREIGAGISIGPNAARLLEGLGLRDRLREVGVVSSGLDAFSFRGEPLSGGAASLRPGYTCHRADLLQALVDSLPPDAVHLGHRCASVVQSAEKVELSFENQVRVVADLVVGADGIHSAVQAAVVAPSPPESEGIMAYRALLPVESLSWPTSLTQARMWLGPGRSFLCYPVSAGRQMNMVAFVPTDVDSPESWSARGEVSALAAEFEHWAPAVRETVAAVDETFRWGIYDRAPLTSWTRGRITLLGDAAHPMVPHIGQGASQAIEDGLALATLLEGTLAAAVPRRLLAYEQLRLPRTSRVQATARAAGSFYRVRGASSEAPPPGARAMQNLDWLYDYDVEAAARSSTGAAG